MEDLTLLFYFPFPGYFLCRLKRDYKEEVFFNPFNMARASFIWHFVATLSYSSGITNLFIAFTFWMFKTMFMMQFLVFLIT